MPTRKRIRTTFVQAGGGGGGPPVVAALEWGPDFGEGSSGSDGKTWTCGVNLDLTSLALDHTKNIGVNLDLTDLSLSNTKSIGAHLSGTVIGAPFWQSVANTSTGTDASDVTVSKPSGVVSGDLLLAFICVSSAVGTPAINTLSGWTLIRTDSITIVGGGVANSEVRSFWRIADGTEGATFTFTFTANAEEIAAEVHRLNGTHATTPIDSNAVATVLATGLDPDPSAPAVTTVAANCLVFAFMFHSHLALDNSHTPPTSHTELTDDHSTAGATRWSNTSATRVFATAGLQAAVEFNCTETVATDAILQRIGIAPGELTIAT